MSISNISLAVPDSGYYCPLCDFPIDDSEHTVELELFRFKLSRLEQFGVEMIVHHEEMARKFGRDNMLIVNGIPRHWTVSAVKKYFGVACSASSRRRPCASGAPASRASPPPSDLLLSDRSGDVRSLDPSSRSPPPPPPRAYFFATGWSTFSCV